MIETQRNPDEKTIEALLKNYAKEIDSRMEWRYKLNSTLILVCVTVFAIVISLHGISERNYCSLLLYRLAVTSNALCIILSGLMIYSQELMNNRIVRNAAELLQSHGRGMPKVGKTIFCREEIKVPKFFLYCQNVSYWIFLLMIIFYTLFALT